MLSLLRREPRGLFGHSALRVAAQNLLSMGYEKLIWPHTLPWFACYWLELLTCVHLITGSSKQPLLPAKSSCPWGWLAAGSFCQDSGNQLPDSSQMAGPLWPTKTKEAKSSCQRLHKNHGNASSSILDSTCQRWNMFCSVSHHVLTQLPWAAHGWPGSPLLR